MSVPPGRPGGTLEDLLARDACAHAHGIVAGDVVPGEARVSMTVRADMLNPHGTCHGGVIFLLADTALGLASNAPGPGSVAPSVTTTAAVTYCAPAVEGDVLHAHAQTVQRGARAGVLDVRVTRAHPDAPAQADLEDGVLVAIFRGNTLRL